MKTLTVVVLVLATLNVGMAYAQSVPGLINYQGKLTNADGSAFADGTYGISFRVYDAATEGNVIWGRTYNVTVANGQFNVILGASGGTALQAAVNDIAFAFTEDSRYIGITVETDGTGAPLGSPQEILPRQQVLSAPYALQSADADHAVLADDATHSDSATESDTSLNNVPVGAIVAWHKDFPNTPQELPEGWVECNGQVLDMSDSPYHGQAIPNLNGPNTSISGKQTKGRFLRGHTESGVAEDDQSNHLNAVVMREAGAGTSDVWAVLPENGGEAVIRDTWLSSTYDSEAFKLKGQEARPVSFTVVWIMRVK